MLQEKKRAVVDPRQAGPEPATKALLVMLPLDKVGLGLPLHAKGRIGQHVIELFARKTIVGKAVAIGDMLDVLSLDHHIRPAYGIGLGVVVLTENLQASIGIQFPDIILGNGQHAAGPPGRVVECFDNALGCEHIAVGHENKIDHQTDHFAGGEMIARLFVRCLVEAPDKLFENVSHLKVRDFLRVQVNVAKPGYQQIETVCFIKLTDVFLEAEVLDNLPGAG